MNFLHGSLWPALGLMAGVPLLIHLLNLQFPAVFNFPTVKYLRESVAQRSRLFRWRHLLLLLLRTLFCLALLLAFLKPVLPRLGSDGEAAFGRAVLVLIDRSLSMEYREAGLSGRKRAGDQARKIISSLGANDKMNVIAVGTTSSACFTHLSDDGQKASRFIEDLGPSLGKADFTQANAAAGQLLANTDKQQEIYYVSDFQRKTWASVDFSALPRNARIFFVDVAGKPRGNRAVLGASVSQSQMISGDSVTVDVEIGNFQDEPLQDPLKVVLDGNVSFEKEVFVGPWSVGKVSIPMMPGGAGLHLCELSLAPDNLPEDDHSFLVIPVQEKEGILIVSDAAVDQRSAALYLKMALNPYENASGSIRPEVIATNELDVTRLATVRKVFISGGSAPFSEAAAKALAEFIFNGGGMLYFLDGQSDAQNLAALQKAMGNVEMPLRLGAKRVAKNLASGAQQISKGDFKSRFLRLFRGSQRQNLSLLEFYDIHEATATGSGQVVLNFADETPAMGVLNHGLGTVVLMNFSVSELSSNLARQRVFPAWIQDIVKNLASTEAVELSSVVNNAVHDEVWKKELADAPLTRPSGAPLDLTAVRMGQRVAISFTPEEVGFYTMRKAKLLHAYGVNPEPGESDLRPIDRDLLPGDLGNVGKRGFYVDGADDLQNLVKGQPVFHWLIYLALGLLMAELAFQLWVRRQAAP